MIKWNKKNYVVLKFSHDARWKSKMDWTFLNDQRGYVIDGEVDTFDWKKDTKYWFDFIVDIKIAISLYKLTHGIDYFQCNKML
jgi:hypothetical protein